MRFANIYFFVFNLSLRLLLIGPVFCEACRTQRRNTIEGEFFFVADTCILSSSFLKFLLNNFGELFAECDRLWGWKKVFLMSFLAF